MKQTHRMNFNQRLLVVEGAASAAYLILTQGALFTALALFFGLDTWWLGVTASFPLGFQLLQLFVPPLLKNLRHRPSILNFFNLLRGLWLIPLAFALAGHISAALFITCFALSQAANAFAANVWMCMMRDLVPQAERGTYFGRRNLSLGIVTILMLPLYTALLDFLPEPWNVVTVVAIGMLATLVAVIAVSRIDDVQLVETAQNEPTGTRPLWQRHRLFWRRLWSDNLARLKDHDFGRLVLAFFAWNLVIQLASPYFALHMIRNLRLPLTLIGFIGTMVSLLSLLTFRLWGRIADRWGHKSVLIAGLLIVSLIPLMWFFMGPPLWPVLLAFDILLTAVGWAAVNLTLLTLPLETAPKADSGYFGLLNAMGGLGGLLGAFIGSSIAWLLRDVRFSLLGVAVLGLQVLFGCNGLLRLVVVLLFARVKTVHYVRPLTLVMNVLSTVARRASLRPAEQSTISRSVDD